MRSIVSPAFRKMLDKLPAHIQDEARVCFQKWKDNPASVGWKRLSGTHADVWSTQIGLRYRAIGVVSKEHDAVVWMFVGSHEDYNNYINVRRKMGQDAWLGAVSGRLRRTRLDTSSFSTPPESGSGKSYEPR